MALPSARTQSYSTDAVWKKLLQEMRVGAVRWLEHSNGDIVKILSIAQYIYHLWLIIHGS
jgi:hypothetical protein